VSVALFMYGDPGTEAMGLRLLNEVSALLRDAVDEIPRGLPAPIGPDFAYNQHPALFHGRRGQGPLHVVWDTNLLIDYFEDGRALWTRGEWSARAATYEDELEALQLVVALWVVRDIRFHVLPRVFTDAKRKLDERRLRNRLNAWEQFAAALRLVGYGEPGFPDPSREDLLWLPDDELVRALSSIPGRLDRALVGDAVKLGAHVFLTRDKQVLAAARQLRPFGLHVASPGDLLEELVASGAFHCLLAPEYAYWPLPDQARVTHLVEALTDRVSHDLGPWRWSRECVATRLPRRAVSCLPCW
jgi:hypothetical protein